MKLIFYRDKDNILWLTKVITTPEETEITLPNYVTDQNYSYNIGNCAFFGNSHITIIHLPMAIGKISTYAFGRCSSLTRIVCKSPIPPVFLFNSFDLLDQEVIIECYKGTKHQYEAALRRTKEGKLLFDNNTQSKSQIILEENDKVLELSNVDSLRYAGEQLDTITIASGVEYIGTMAYLGADDIATPEGREYFVVETGNNNYISEVDNSVLMSNIDTQRGVLATSSLIPTDGTITCSINANAFYNRNNRSSPGQLTLEGEYIHDLAFQACHQVSSIAIGPNVKYIAPNAFYNMSNLKTVQVNSDNQYYISILKNQVLLNKDKTELLWVSNYLSNDDFDELLIFLCDDEASPRLQHLPAHFLENIEYTNWYTLNIPDKITYIGYNALKNFEVVETVSIGKNTKLADGALATIINQNKLIIRNE